VGLDYNGSRALLWLSRSGVPFTRLGTLGRQGIYIEEAAIARNLRDFGFASPTWPRGSFAEPFFRLLGAQEIVSFDASTYEGATVVHDFNQPINSQFAERFDVMFDGGSLEHVFNVPVALANCMSMVKVNGYYVACHPCNNFFGHGFYQFSPELYFRVFSPENGFAVEHLIACEDFLGAPWFRVADPASVQSRVILVNGRQTYLIVVARKLASRAQYFAHPPEQSDYAAAWETGQWSDGLTTRSKGRPDGLMRRLIRPLLPMRAREVYAAIRRDREMRDAIRLARHFELFDPTV
jgi:hypothetical protein